MGGRTRHKVEGPGRFELLDDAMHGTGSITNFISEAVGKLIHILDTRIHDELLQLPPGTLLCVHGAVTFMPQDVQGRLQVRQDTHVIASLADECPHIETGGHREVYTSPWVCRGCGQRATPAEGRACDECVDRFRRESVRLGLDGMVGGP